ncbi:uncharacterized protein [Onthophagus taurus]|uniref:uncharacterized protein n=3 Tax=Onthophagus taurus TaxID=166361 RepID=UPI0039BE8312
MLTCDVCYKEFTRPDNLVRHQRTACIGKRRKVEEDQQGDVIVCEICDEHVTRQCYSSHLRSNKHKQKAFVIIDDGVEKIDSIFGDKICSFRVSDHERKYVDMKEFSNRIREKVISLIQSVRNVNGSLKVNTEIFGLYFINTKEEVEIKSFNTKNKIITVAVDLYQTYEDFMDEIMVKMSEFQERDSGWTLLEILYLEVNCNKFNPTRASSYIDLPTSIKGKRAVINVQNNDNKCFAWALMSALYQPTGLPQRISSYPDYRETELKFDCVTFPVPIRDIPKFEEENNISINVYGINSWYNGEKMVDDIVTVCICKQKRERHVNLLVVSDNFGNNHYCWIKNLSRLINTQSSTHEHQRYICEGCLQYFSTEDKLVRHQMDDCKKVKATVPSEQIKVNKFGHLEKENVLQFEGFEKKMKVPFVVYADFEAILKPLTPEEGKVYDDNKPYTARCFEHEPYAFAYYIKCAYDDNLSKFRIYRGRNAALEFIIRLEKDVIEIYKQHLRQTKDMIPLSCLDQFVHELSSVCHICDKPINKEEKVCDHDHLTGLYRGPAHSVCNINYKLPMFIPVFFHNLSNYDAHMFVKSIALNKEEVEVIAQNKEKYISFSKKIVVGETTDNKGKKRKVFMKIRFVDSFRFMASSLEKLVSYLDDKDCVEVKKKFKDSEEFRLMSQKGVFPYSFVDSFEKLEYSKLPDHTQFYDILSSSNISKEQYSRAQTVWNKFKCTTLGEYSDLYLTSDVLMLTDVFENFRTISLENYNLDPCHYYTAPGFGWDALLKMTGVKLELLSDIDMLHFFKKGIRGGLCMCVKRSAIANNKFLDDFNPEKPSSYILYLDATNLYGYAMSCKLPTGGFRWLSNQEIADIDVECLDDEHLGYVFEVDLEYPERLHNQHDDLPFCPENIIAPGSKHPKLIANLQNKSKYIIHYVNLRECVKKGLKLTKIHRALQFQQSPWMKPYIDFNSEKRMNATNEFGKNHYKQMNNIVYGKTMENVENRVDIRLVSHWENRYRRPGAEALIAKPTFKSSKIFCHNLVAIEMQKVEVKYNKPLYVGFSVLELSKAVIYNFFYNFLKEKYGENVLLLYTDTDSLILEIFTENVYQDIKENIEMFDTSNYKLNNRHNIPPGPPIVGKMKDEYPNTILTSFYGTGAKAYCINTLEGVVKRAKGVKKYVIDKNLSVSEYKRIIEDGGSVRKKMYVFRSSYHTMYTELKNKVALSAHDDKRYVMEDGCHTLAWGNYLIEDLRREDLLDNLLELLNVNMYG